ncbi:antibiotic biosynthesis monooxygenase [Sphingomonas sp. KRR8]|uniref:putative quinol monooxygenase n=1 Tax=Sphingomonas sp. KRR8 TaxID=2942996 RepID=UPI002021CBC7|nr:putative quinol monooxygenase [Sphingomonas sp. KRR8]URD60737.1 antibiotic biosynthesis monooxygenase [Sphingomonas sp. KRR8]
MSELWASSIAAERAAVGLAGRHQGVHDVPQLEIIMSVKVVAFVTVKQGQEEAFVAAAQPCIAASRAETGVLRYDLWQEVDGDRRFVFDELYFDHGAVQAHMASDHFKAFGLAARDLAATRPSITVAEAIEVAS